MLSCSAINKENLEKEIFELRKKLEEKEEELTRLKSSEETSGVSSHKKKLSRNEIARYSRQMIIPEIGVKGQLALKKSSVLIVGAGGLGCPAAMYLGGAGVGHIGIVDYDEVELNNLHRQLLHYESNIGETKASSASQALHSSWRYWCSSGFGNNKDSLWIPGILSGRLIMFDGMDSSFRNVSLRQRNPQCAVCGENPTVTGLVDYEVMCMTRANDKDQRVQILSDSERISPQECQQILKSNTPHMLIDVRQPIEFEMCHIDGATNFPMKNLKNRDLLQKLKQRITNDTQVIVVCRRGNDSQKATVQLRESLLTAVKDIRGGLHAWAREVDPNFPVY